MASPVPYYHGVCEDTSLRPKASEFGFATNRDLPRIVELLRDDPIARERESDDLQNYRTAFEAIDADPNQFLIVAREEGVVVGFLQLTQIAGISRNGTSRALIESVRVADTHRGRGVGRALLTWTIDLARENGCGLIQLTTDARRDNARKFYEDLGFEATHVGMKRSL